MYKNLFHDYNFINNRATVAIGQKINTNNKNNSQKRRKINIIISAIITNVLITIPIPIATAIKSFLYSFFHGTKKVLTRSGNEKNVRKALFTEPKYLMRFFGPSKK